MTKIQKILVERNQAYSIISNKNVGTLNLKVSKTGPSIIGILGFENEERDYLIGAICFRQKLTIEGVYFSVTPIFSENNTKILYYQLDLDLTDSTKKIKSAEKIIKSFIRKITKVAHDRMVNKVLKKEAKPKTPYLMALSNEKNVGDKGLANYRSDLGNLFTASFIEHAIRLKITYAK